jgi:phosphate transport system substrate-binding protein
LTGEWAHRPISLYGRNSASGTYGFFKEHVLRNGDYRSTVKEQPGSSSVVQGVANDLSSIGYSGIGYKTSGVKALALAEATGKALHEPSLENALNGAYPLARFLFIYVNKKPNEPMDKLVHEFVKFVNSKEGQEIVVKDGYYPMPAAIANETLMALK